MAFLDEDTIERLMKRCKPKPDVEAFEAALETCRETFIRARDEHGDIVESFGAPVKERVGDRGKSHMIVQMKGAVRCARREKEIGQGRENGDPGHGDVGREIVLEPETVA